MVWYVKAVVARMGEVGYVKVRWGEVWQSGRGLFWSGQVRFGGLWNGKIR